MQSNSDLEGTVAVITGAKRGIGRATAVALGVRGATVYVTGRGNGSEQGLLPGSIDDTAAAVTAAGGAGIAVVCDHSDDGQIRALFERVRADHGRLDLLVNNVHPAPPELLAPPPFWTKSLALADQITVGLRSSYVAAYYAAPLLIASEKPLVVNVSSHGAVIYNLDPAYGATKAGLDKMTFDMAQDFAEFGVSVVSFWPGPAATEFAVAALSRVEGGSDVIASLETPEFIGRVLAELYADPETKKLSGTVVIGAEFARDHGITEGNGTAPPSPRDYLGPPTQFVGQR